MNDIGKPERETQNRVIALFRDELRYRYLGDWSDHPANSNIQEDLLTAHLARVGYTTAQINRAIFILRKEADNPNRSLYDNNKAVYSLLRYGVPINDAWESIPLACVDNVIALLDREIPLSHPLRAYKLFPVAKCFRQEKYLLEEEDASDLLWVLDMGKKIRRGGKTYFYFKRMETQKELDAMFQDDYNAWVQYMKRAGSWHGA